MLTYSCLLPAACGLLFAAWSLRLAVICFSLLMAPPSRCIAHPRLGEMSGNAMHVRAIACALLIGMAMIDDVEKFK